MEEASIKKTGLLTFLLIILLVIAIGFSIFIYLLYSKETDEVAKQKNEINSLNTKIAELQGELDKNKISVGSNTVSEENVTDENIVHDNIPEVKNDEKKTEKKKDGFTKNEINSALKNYLELSSTNGSVDLLIALNKKGKIKYRESKNKELPDGSIETDVKFADYKKAMLHYVSEKEFNKNWNETFYEENEDGYLVAKSGGGSNPVYTIKELTKDGDTYVAKTTYIADITEPNPKYSKTFKFTVVETYVGNCAIDTIE